MCTCNWCLLDNLFAASRHLGPCKCYWCELDNKVLAGEANEPENIRSIITCDSFSAYSENCSVCSFSENVPMCTYISIMSTSDTGSELTVQEYAHSVIDFSQLMQVVNSSIGEQTYSSNVTCLISSASHLTGHTEGLQFLSVSLLQDYSSFSGDSDNCSLHFNGGSTLVTQAYTTSAEDSDTESVLNSINMNYKGLHCDWGFILLMQTILMSSGPTQTTDSADMSQMVVMANKRARQHNTLIT